MDPPDPPPYDFVEKSASNLEYEPNTTQPVCGAPPSPGFVVPQGTNPAPGLARPTTVTVTYQPVFHPNSPSGPIVATPPVTAVLVRPIVLSLPTDPIQYTCPTCNKEIRTRVVHRPGIRTHLIALFLCLFGCWVCAPIPYCCDNCKDAHHYCSNCNALVGVSNN